ncbi:DNA primase [Candidatus Dependentiae bacterium]|nr:DNA primase [Candidatus Dependentiae bacterium]
MDLFHFIKDQIEIISVISEYTLLKKTGSWYWKGLCPFHHEKTASFTVSPHKKIFYCFGCHQSGDVINFIEKIENVSAFQAAQHLIQRYQLDIPETLKETAFFVKQEKTAFRLCSLVAQWCNNKLSKNRNAEKYLLERNINSAMSSRFSVGFFPDGSKSIQDLLSFVHQNGFSAQELLQEHILVQGKTGMYSPFENRIMFPIKDQIGQVCGFGGRIFLPNDQRPKYYNSKETSSFKKGKILFGFDLAKYEIQKQKAAFIVEGYTDCIAMHQHGYLHTVATLGTACTLDHLKQLSRHVQMVYVLYDADQAGKQAMLKLTQLCWQLDIELKVVLLPQEQDPASILEKEHTLEPYLEQSKDIFSYFLQFIKQEYEKSSIKDKVGAIAELLDLIYTIQDDLKQNILLIKASEMLQVPLEILKKEYNNKYKEKQGQHQESRPSIIEEKPDQDLEQQIIAVIFYDPSLVTKQDEALLYAALDEFTKNIIEKILQQYKASSDKEAVSLLTVQELEYVQRVLFKIESQNIKQLFSNLMIQFQKKYWKSVASHIKMKILYAKQNNNKQEVRDLIDIFESFKKKLYKNGRL